MRKFDVLIVCFVCAQFSEYSRSQSINIFGCLLTKPECPNANVSFYFYTRETQANPTKLNLSDPQSVVNANYAKNRPLIILIHGYTGDRDYSPNSHIRPALFEKGEFNVVSVDYGELAKYPCYLAAVTNAPIVANCTAQFIDFMLDNNVFALEDIHVIGFSLGAQTAGIMTRYMRSGRKLKRITGLDPAKPLFIRVGNEGRLDQSDAEFVDIIHTDVFDRGLLVPLGHLDHYVNGGFNQPGCLEQTEMSAGSCNHDRAPQYFAESINSEKGFWGYQCAHWYFYVLGMCSATDEESLVEMGFNANSTSRGLYFLQTNRQKPFARGKDIASSDTQQDEFDDDNNEI